MADSGTFEKRQKILVNLEEIFNTCARFSTKNEIVQAIGRKLSTYLNISNCCLACIDEAQDSVADCFWSTGNTPEIKSGDQPASFVTGEFLKTVQAGKTIAISNTQNDPLTNAEACAAFDIHAFVAVPFHRNGIWKYLFTANSFTSRNWRKGEIRLIRDTANIMFLHIEQIVTETALQKCQEQLAMELESAKLIQNLSTQLIQADNVEELYDQILTTMITILHSDFAILQLFHPERGPEGELHLLRHRGFDNFDTRVWEWVTPRSQISCGMALNTRRRVAIPDVLQSDFMAGSIYLEAYRQIGIRAVQTTPLFSRSGNLLGMFSTLWREPHELTASEIRSLDVLARQAADLIERAQAEEALRRSEAQQAFLLQLGDVTRHLADPHQIQSESCRLLGEHLGVDRIFFCDINEDEGLAIIQPDYFREGLISLAGRHAISDFIEMPVLLKNGSPLSVNDTTKSRFLSGKTNSAYLAHGIRAYVSVPLVKDGKLVWTLNAASTANREWAAQEISLIKEVAERSWSAVERARAEAALQKAHDQLEQKVIERTAELARANEILQQEINERMQAERALIESKEKYRLLVDNTPDLIFSYDREFRYTFVNRSKCRFFGLEEDEIVGKTPHDLGLPKDLVREWENMFHEAMAGNTVQRETIVPLPDGTARTFWLALMPVFDERGNVTVITGTGRDLTERKKMETEILKADKLESIGILAGGIAHDFNNYLAMLLANITLAKLYKDDPKMILEKLENMEKAIMRAKDLSNQLFTFAKGGAPVKEKISIKELIADNIKFTLSGSNIRPEIFIADNLHMVEIDEGQFSQVLDNISINAVQAMPEGGVLEVKAENVTLEAAGGNSFVPLPEGAYIKITIKDEGTGIPEKYLSKIYDPFFTTKDKGRGLGLATAYSIIKNHGGYLCADSQMGVGTSFFIYLPAVTESETSPSASDNVYRGTGKILLMDDEEDLLTVTGEALTALGYDVVLARDGKEAIELYLHALNNKQPFDLIIMDLTIPGGMGGKQTIKEVLRQDPGVKAIVASGYSNDPVMANFQDYGFKGAVKKPFTLEALSKAVYEALR